MPETHRERMKNMLCESLRILMEKYMFEKITIKMICDKTGVIRATFYNYFDDKYACLNEIVYQDLVEETINRPSGMNDSEVFIKGLENVDRHLSFYRKAYGITGQNSFEDMIRDNLTICFLEYFKRNRDPEYLPNYSNDLLARHYGAACAFHFREYVFRKSGTAQDEIKVVRDLLTHSYHDFSRKNNRGD